MKRAMRRIIYKQQWLYSKVLLITVVIILLLPLLGMSVLSYRNTITPLGIIIHHSAVPPPPGGTPIDVSVLDSIHEKRGFSIFYWGRTYHVGYHYIILPDGTVQRGRPDHCQGAPSRQLQFLSRHLFDRRFQQSR